MNVELIITGNNSKLAENAALDIKVDARCYKQFTFMSDKKKSFELEVKLKLSS
jgi:hypothetical protein